MCRRRLVDAFDLAFTQDTVPFAIPNLDEDIPLYLDPFLLWSSADANYRQLHDQLVSFMAQFGSLAIAGEDVEAQRLLLTCREPRELGLGYAQDTKQGSFIGPATAKLAVQLYVDTPQLHNCSMKHIEELGLLLPRIAEDRISDLTACVLREFLVRYTAGQAKEHEIPSKAFRIPEIWDAETLEWRTGLKAHLPYHPDTDAPLLFAPLDLLRHLPWINYPDYYKSYYSRFVLPARMRLHQVPKTEVLAQNRANYVNVESYVRSREQAASQAKPDPLFEPLAISTLGTKLRRLRKLATGADHAADYEKLVEGILTTALYPELELAESQVRTLSGAHIRDLLFYNDGKTNWTKLLIADYGARQLVFELKNVKKLEPEHVNQLYRYLDGDFGRIGVLVSRAAPPRAVRKNIVDLHSSKRAAIICLTDEDLALMLRMLEAKRRPIDVIKKKYVEFTRSLPK
jgi:hypothetical protein